MVLCCTRVSIARAQDFRIINMSVSPDKVKDTAELFYMQNQRKISLRYMAWYFLGMDVQVRMCCTSPQCNWVTQRAMHLPAPRESCLALMHGAQSCILHTHQPIAHMHFNVRTGGQSRLDRGFACSTGALSEVRAGANRRPDEQTRARLLLGIRS